MYDAGGRQNKQKKWIQCFEDISTIIFVAANQALFKDASAYRLTKAVNLFGTICYKKVFQELSMILI
jgi:hypothetical protein